MYSILEQVAETPSTKTLRMDGEIEAVPGQFVMVWVPGVDEFPMSISYSGERFGFTYQMVGEGTKALAAIKEGNKIGIRGPYGRGFSIRGRKLLVVGGGTGMAPLGLFVEEAVRHGASVTAAIGARTSDELLFEGRCVAAGARVVVSTDDGTKGYRGLATELAANLIDKEAFDSMYACGPEKMIVGLLGIARKKSIQMQASLERIMKCGIGICDSCALDGRHVCRDGPVFSDADLVSFSELGRTKLDASGRKIPV